MSEPGLILPALTGLRFLLVGMLFLYHYVDRLDMPYPCLIGVAEQFYLAPNMFFVLSGFVICLKYFNQVGTARGGLRPYYFKRAAKIYPTFFSLTLLTYLVLLVSQRWSAHLIKEWLLNITLLKGFSENYFLTGIGPSWSLTVEVTFYMLAPVIFQIFRKYRVLFGQVAIWWVAGGVLLLAAQSIPNDGFFGSPYFVYFATFFGRCFEFYCGIFLALQILGHKPLFGPQRKSFRWPAFTCTGICWMAAGIALLYVNQYHRANDSLVKILLSNLFYPVGVAIFYFGLIRERTWLQRWLSTRPLQLLGHSSYAFFLVHTGVVAVGLEKYLTRNVALLFVLLQLVSIGIFLFFERPVSRLIRSRLPVGA